ncbi:MAG: hypothetical protein JST40_04340 [Armatimonadetes bacterium]|nr:hypothetical protein [Armatimonadota bacterium]
MIVCNLTKPESTLDQVKKNYPKLKQTDAALIASALVVSGRQALAVYEGEQYAWTKDYDNLTVALKGQLLHLQEVAEPVKKTKSAPEEEPVEIKVGLIPNYAAGEQFLTEREDLKTLFADILQGGVEYQYSATDIGWQWSLDRVNWTTISDGELSRRFKLKATFQGDAVGVEMGLTPKRGSKKKAAVEVAVEPEADAEVIEE